MSKNAVDEFLTLKKTAGKTKVAAGPWQDFGKHLSHAAAGGLATATVGAGLAGIGIAAGKILDAATKSHDFRQMLDANEDLHEHYNADPKRFNMMFSTLRTMNPEFSKDPLVAGAFMRQMHDSPTGIAGIASEALKHRGDFPNHMMDSISQFGRAGAQTGAGESFKQRTPEELLEQKKPEMDYAHGLGMKMKAPELGLKAQEMAQREKQHGESMAASKSNLTAQLRSQQTLARMPERMTTTEFDANDKPRGSSISTKRKGY